MQKKHMPQFLNIDHYNSAIGARRTPTADGTETVMRSFTRGRLDYDLDTCGWMYMVEVGYLKGGDSVAAFAEWFLPMCEWYGVTAEEPSVTDLQDAILGYIASAKKAGIYQDVAA